jgi:glycine cleavage system H protein
VSDFPTELKYADSHEWARLESDGIVVVGITNHAQDALGDIVFIELPESGAEVDAGAEIAVVESVKAASDIYSPVSGEIVEVNTALEDEPELVNGSPYEDGWLFTIKVSSTEDLNNLLDAEGYQAIVEDEQ